MISGIVSIIKPSGMTSHDVVSVARRVLGEKKIGHCGTLDPQTGGVLPICVGKATRLCDYVGNDSKSYYTKMKLGKSSDTLDAWGRITEEKEVPKLTYDMIVNTLKTFIGGYYQKIPDYSSHKENGVESYKLARSGEVLDNPEKWVDIKDIYNISFNCEDNTIGFSVDCGKGTYVRALCRDLALKLGTVGYMTFLIRTRTGSFNLNSSISIEEFVENGEKSLLNIEKAVENFPKISLEDNEAIRISQGQHLWIKIDEEIKDGFYASFNKDNKLVGLGHLTVGYALKEGYGLYKADKVFK